MRVRQNRVKRLIVHMWLINLLEEWESVKRKLKLNIFSSNRFFIYYCYDYVF